MTGIEIVVGYLAAWAWLKARRAARRADADLDMLIDAGVDHLYDLVHKKLGADPALAKLERDATEDLDAAQPQVSATTRQRVVLSLQEATEDDPQFAQQLQSALDRLSRQGGATALGGWLAVGGDINVMADRGSTAIGVAHDVTFPVPSRPHGSATTSPDAPPGPSRPGPAPS